MKYCISVKIIFGQLKIKHVSKLNIDGSNTHWLHTAVTKEQPHLWSYLTVTWLQWNKKSL